MLEIRFHGRGGQGAYLASWLLASALFKEGYWAHAFPRFGAERRGAAIETFLRVSKRKITTRSMITNPDIVVVFDARLLKSEDIIQGLREDGLLIINSSKAPSDLFPRKPNFEVITFDANSIAIKHELGTPTSPIINTVILGAFAGITRICCIENIARALKEKEVKNLKKNIAAMGEAFQESQNLKTRDWAERI